MGHVFRAMGFDCPKNISPQKESALFGHQIPVLRLQKVHAVGKREAEPGRPMAFLMPFLYGLNGRRQPCQRTSYFTRHAALHWQSEFSFKRQKTGVSQSRGCFGAFSPPINQAPAHSK